MPFDYKAALQAGASEDDILNYLKSRRSFDIDAALEQKIPKEKIIQHLSAQEVPKEEPASAAPSPAFRPLEEESGPGFMSRANEFVKGFSDVSFDVLVGAGKGIGSTIFGIGQLGAKLISPLEKTLGVERTSEEIIGGKPEFLKPKGTAQQIGFTTEQIAEFLIPTTAVLKGAKAISAAAGAAKISPLLQSVARVGGRAALEGITSGGIRAAQTGEFKEGAKFGAITGGLSAGIGAAGEFLRRVAFPEKLYSQVFRNSYDDMSEALRTGGLKNLQAKSPEKFKELVEAGVIKSKGGIVEFNPTLAREALDRGLKGSLKNMSNEVVRQNLNYELQARQLAAGFKKTLEVPRYKDYIKLLKQVQAQYESSFLSSRGEIAGEFINQLKKGKGFISAENTLKLRRYLDSMRRASSYRPNPNLSIAAEDFKSATDILRGVLSKNIQGMGKVMNEYRFTFDALEALGKEAMRRGNSAVINLIDTALFGFGGVLTQGVAGAAAFPLTRRALTLPSVVTGLGSKIEQGIRGTAGRLLKGAAVTIFGKKPE